jgi:hypothetical protein
MKREKYEWADIWWEEADNAELGRALLIGDSIARDYRKGVQEKLRGVCLVDSLTTSKGIDDPMLAMEVNYMLAQYPYRLICFNNGLHGQHVGIRDYRASLRYIANILLSACPLVALATSTPASERANLALYGARNEQVRERNAAAREIAESLGLAVCDLYAAMEGRPEYKKDSSHFTCEGIAVQAAMVADLIRGAPSFTCL